MRILLLSGAIGKCEKHGDYGKAAPQMYPYGVLCLASVLEKNGFSNIKILDTEVRAISNEHVIDEIGKFRPDIIGVTTYTLAMKTLAQLLADIKRSFDDIILVAGGPHVTLYPKDLVEKGLVDYCCAGEGEYPFLELVKAVDKKGKMDNIPNLVFKDGEKVMHNPNRPLIRDLDELPFPSFHLLRDDINRYYPQPMAYKKRPVATLITSRGCPYGCKFCSAEAMWTRRWRCNSASYVVSMMEYLKKEFGVKEICFFEDTFAVNRKRVIELCELLIKRDINIIWSASVNLRDIDEEVARYMRDAGCWMVIGGIETGNEEVMKFINKPLTVREAEQKVKMLDKLGIKVKAYFMLGHMIDTKNTLRETIEFSKSLPLFTANYSIFVPTPGSAFHDSLYCQTPKREDYELQTYATEGRELGFVPDGLTTNYLIHIQRKAFIEFFLRFSQIMVYVKSFRSLEDVRRYAIMFYAAVTLLARKIKAKPPENSEY